MKLMRLIYLFLALAFASATSAQSLHHPVYKLSLVHGLYTTKKSERIEKTGSGTLTTTGIYGLKTYGLQLGAEYPIKGKWSLAIDLQGTYIKQLTRGETGYVLNGVAFHGTYPREITLKTFSLQPKLYYDLLPFERIGLKFGMGPTLLHSNMNRLTYMSGEFDAHGYFFVEELGWSKRKVNGVGLSNSILADFSVRPNWRIFSSGQFDFYGNDWLLIAALGVGYSFL